MGNHGEFDLDVRLTDGRSLWTSHPNFLEGVPEGLTIHQQTCEGCAPTGIERTCADSCDVCDTQQTCAGQNTCPATQCDTCLTCQTQCNQNTCQQTCAGQNTCQTCQTQCNRGDCITLNTCVGNTCEFCTIGNCP